MGNCRVCGAEIDNRRKTCSDKCRAKLSRQKQNHDALLKNAIHLLYFRFLRYHEKEKVAKTRDDLLEIKRQIEDYIKICDEQLEGEKRRKQREKMLERRQNHVRKW